MPMASNQKASIFATERFLATELHQNNLDEIHGLLEQFCNNNKEFKWYLVLKSSRQSGITNTERYLSKKTPKKLTYIISNQSSSRELIIHIDNGVTINIKNGSHSLYGLFKQLEDLSPSMEASQFFVFLRRYWLFNLLGSILIIPSLLIILFGGGWWFLAWFIVIGLVEFFGTVTYFEDKPQDSWKQVILSTKIHYDIYNTRSKTSVYAILSSTKTTISVLASLATVITFIILFISR